MASESWPRSFGVLGSDIVLWLQSCSIWAPCRSDIVLWLQSCSIWAPHRAVAAVLITSQYDRPLFRQDHFSDRPLFRQDPLSDRPLLRSTSFQTDPFPDRYRADPFPDRFQTDPFSNRPLFRQDLFSDRLLFNRPYVVSRPSTIQPSFIRQMC